MASHNIKDYTHARLPKEVRETLKTRITELKTANTPYLEIIDVLNKEGFITAHNKPINMDFLRNQIWRMRATQTLPKMSGTIHPITKVKAILKGKGTPSQKIKCLNELLNQKRKVK